MGDFHRRRTGEGQAAAVSLAHCATWGAGLVMPYLCDPGDPARAGTHARTTAVRTMSSGLHAPFAPVAWPL